MSVPVIAAAAVLDPFAMGSVSVDGDNEIVHVDFPTTDIFWRSYQDNVLTKTGFGETFQITLQEKAIDNNYTETLLFGNNHFFPSSGVTSDTAINADLLWGLSAPGVSQSFQLFYKLCLRTVDENMNSIAVHVLDENTFDYSPSVSSVMGIPWNVSFSGSLLEGSSYYNLYVTWDYAAINDESVSTSISLTMQSALSLDIPYSQLWMLREQGAQTNKLLDQIDQQMAANGEKLDDVIAQGQANGEKLDGIAGDIQENGNKLDDLISGGDGAQDLYEGSDKLQDAGDGLGDNIGQIHDFEDIYMGELEDNLDDIIAGADVSMLVAPLSFIHNYTNKIVSGVPSQYLVVFTLPMLFGIFMYIVGHPVRAPRPDTSGDIVTRETFSTSTIVGGPKDGQSRSTRTVTTSREIRRIHKE